MNEKAKKQYERKSLRRITSTKCLNMIQICGQGGEYQFDGNRLAKDPFTHIEFERNRL